MFGIGSFNPISLLATSMLGPIGGVVAQLAQQVFSQMGQQILQQFGDKLGLPQGIIDMAQSQFAGSIGDFQGAASNVDEALDQFGAGVGASPSDIAQAQNGVQQMMMQFIEEMSQSEEFKDAKASGGKGKVAGSSAGSTGAPGWLMAMARSLGSTLNKLGDEMEQVSNQIKDGKASLSTEFTVLGQQFSMVSNASGTTLKAVGEGMANMARKG